MWETAANTASCSAALIRYVSAPTACHKDSSLQRPSESSRPCGVMMSFLPRYRPNWAASAPLRSEPAIGWAAMQYGRCPGRQSRKASSADCLVLPTSDTSVPALRNGAMLRQMADRVDTGVAMRTKSAAAILTSPTVSKASSITPRSSARSRLLRLRSMPATFSTSPSRFKSSANEPPMRPTPIRVICLSAAGGFMFSAKPLKGWEAV